MKAKIVNNNVISLLTEDASQTGENWPFLSLKINCLFYMCSFMCIRSAREAKTTTNTTVRCQNVLKWCASEVKSYQKGRRTTNKKQVRVNSKLGLVAQQRKLRQ